MPTEIKLPYSSLENKIDQIEQWLIENAGSGSIRYGGREGEIRHWLNGEDWLYYIQYQTNEQSKLESASAIYIFKDERVATEFALRFS